MTRLLQPLTAFCVFRVRDVKVPLSIDLHNPVRSFMCVSLVCVCLSVCLSVQNLLLACSFGLPDRIPRFAKCSYNVVVKSRKDLPACIRPGQLLFFRIFLSPILFRSHLLFGFAFGFFRSFRSIFSLPPYFAHITSPSVLPHETRYNLPSVFVLRHSHARSVASASQGAGLKLPPTAAGVVAVKRPLPEVAVGDPADAVASKTTAVGHETNGRCGARVCDGLSCERDRLVAIIMFI